MWLLSKLLRRLRGRAVDPLGLLETLIVFKLKAGCNKKYCSNTISGLNSG